MSFFDDLPEPAQRPRQPQPLRPGWAGPPSDELPGVVHIGEFVHSGPQLVMAVKLVEVYSTGCALELTWSVRRTNETEREWRHVMEQTFSRPGSPGAMVGVGFPDGRRAVASYPSPQMFDGTDDVSGPVLTMIGGGGGSGSDEQVQGSAKYWLWPLPLEGDSELVAKWDELGMSESSLRISGADLSEALGKVRKYWSE
ncbi:hypothetical protein ACIQC5_01225 [Paenarthrobacter sp. NPDC092416]|uniref:hypothetical protein n=1 Tax=Paenarthrobacter sp. NPDC092416 TaxID=3364386 RepID=UPI003800733F